MRQERETSVSRGYTSTRKGVSTGKTRCSRHLAQEQPQREPVITQMLNWVRTNSLEAPPPSQVVLMVKSPPASAGDVSELGSVLRSGRPLEEEMATHSSVLAWRIPRTEDPSGPQSIGSQRVRHD